jgi:hypothetical protein
MRAAIWAAGGVLVACLASPASAQFVATSTSGVSQTGVQGSVPGPNSVGITEHIINTLTFREFFRPIIFSSKVNVNANVGATTSIPDPNSPEYMQAFGYKRLTSIPPKHWWLWWDN